jgi:dihydroflavonol-4-reductase
MTLLQILQTIDDLSGRRTKRINLPANLILPLAWMMEKSAMITNIEPRATVDSVRMAKKKMFFSSEKAVRELGYQFRPATEALRDAMSWFQDNGYCSGISIRSLQQT